jgi:hypothetical protein
MSLNHSHPTVIFNPTFCFLITRFETQSHYFGLNPTNYIINPNPITTLLVYTPVSVTTLQKCTTLL